MKNLLSAKDLSIKIHKGNNTYTAVDRISFDLFDGEIAGIVGESGCGKTLTALSLAGLLPVSIQASGEILFSSGNGAQERDLLSLNDDELCTIRGKEISMIFQEPFASLNPLKKIGRQITETLEIHQSEKKGIDKKTTAEENQKKCISLMKKLNLADAEKLMESYPSNLSGGMCQRAMIASAIIAGPRLLIADEPTTALDNNTQIQIIELLKDINREQGTSILFISHDLEIVKKLCSRVMVMYAGKLVETGKTEEIFSNPAHEYTKGLLGCIPGNQNGKKLFSIPGKVPALEEAKPAGCIFHPRCSGVVESCRLETPEQLHLSETHSAYCRGPEK